MKKVYVCSPCASIGDKAENIERAKGYCKEIIAEGNIPIAPHVFYGELLDDQDKEQRAKALLIGLEMIRECKEMNIYPPISEGMKYEIMQAVMDGVTVRIMKKLLSSDVEKMGEILMEGVIMEIAGKKPLESAREEYEKWQRA